MRTRGSVYAVAILLSLRVGGAAADEPLGSVKTASKAERSAANDIWLRRIERLSIDMRSRRLSPEERLEATSLLQNEVSPEKAYASYVDRWLDRDFFRRVQDAETHRIKGLFVGELAAYQDPTSRARTYFLPDAHRGASALSPPCTTAETMTTPAWWLNGKKVLICADSVKREVTFDSVGYCGGQAEPSIPNRRPACGCGPFLMGCLPPHEEGGIDTRLEDDAKAEYVESVAEVLISGRPWDDVLGMSETWRTGLLEFMYLRREMLGSLARRSPGPDFERKWGSRIAALHLSAPGAWTKRTGIYAGAGAELATVYDQADSSNYRVQIKRLLERYLCVTFKGVNVDRDAVFESVANAKVSFTSQRVHESPMRTLQGCKGCHAPMDYGAGFLVGLSTPVYGSYPTGETAEGKLFVLGGEDYRGSGTGYADLARLVVKQPEFERCSVGRAFARIAGGIPAAANSFVGELEHEFHASHHDLGRVYRSVLKSRYYYDPSE